MSPSSSFASVTYAVLAAALLVGSAVTCHRPAPSGSPALADEAVTPLGTPPPGQTLFEAEEAGAPPVLPPQPVDFGALQGVLPERFGRYERTAVRGERRPMGAFAMSQARATYRAGEDEIELLVADGGGGGRLREIGAVWVGRTLDETDPHGYERTIQFGGRPAYERLDTRPERARTELQLVAGGRFFVLAEGRGGEMHDLRLAVEALDLAALVALADGEGREGGE